MSTESNEKGFLRRRMFGVVIFAFIVFWAFVLWDVISGAHLL